MFNDGLQELIGARKLTEPQQAEEGLAGLLTGAPQEPTLPGMLETAPDEVQSQFGQLVEQFGPPPESVVRDIATLQSRQSSGGGMFDAYSESNQGNLKMAMLVDIIGKLGGRDVGAMKTMMPLAENARKLRLQGEENAAYDKIVSKFTPQQQKFLKALPISMRPMAMKQLLEQQFAVPTSPLVSMTEKVSSKVEPKAYDYLRESLGALNTEGKAALVNLQESELMLELLNEVDEHGEYRLKTGPAGTLKMGAGGFWNSWVDQFAPESQKKAWMVEGVDRAELLDTLSKSKTLLKAALMKGNLSEKELDFSTDTVAHMMRTREGNLMMAHLSKLADETALGRSRYMDQWYKANLSKYGENYTAFDAAFNTELDKWNADDRVAKKGRFKQLAKDLGWNSSQGSNTTETPAQTAYDADTGKNYIQKIPGDANSWEEI